MNSAAPERRLGWRIVIVALLALVLRGVWVVGYERHHPQAHRPTIDEQSYDAWARELAAGDWLGDEVFFQEPLYPYVLGVAYALFGADTAVARGLNVLLGVVFVVVTALVTARIAGRRWGLLIGVVAALARPLVHTTALVLKPSLFLALLSLLVLALLAERERSRPWRALAVGALGALAALVRGNALLLLPLVVVWPWVRLALDPARRPGARVGARVGATVRAALARDARAVAWALGGALLVLVPVAVRNAVVGGVPLPTTSGAGTNLHVGNHPSNPWGVATELDFVRGIPEHEASDWRREAERRTGRTLGPGEVSSYWLGETLRSFVQDPATHAAIFARKLRLALHRGEVADNHAIAWDAAEVRRGAGGATWSVWAVSLPLSGWWPWGALGFAGVLLALLRPSALRTVVGPRASEGLDLGAAREVALLFVAYLATLVLTVVVGRMRLPLFVFGLPLVPVALAPLLTWARARGDERTSLRSAGLSAAVALLVAAVFALTPARPRALEAADLAERDFNLTVQLLEEGSLDDARARVGALRQQADSPRVRVLAAEVALAAARRARAEGDEAAAQRAMEDSAAALAGLPATAVPDEPPSALGARTEFQLAGVRGRLALVRGDAATAQAELARARSFDPEDPALALDELRARAMTLWAPSSAGVASAGGGAPRVDRSAVMALRAEAAALAQGATLPEALRTSARVLWAELEWLASVHEPARLVDALKILQGTLATVPPESAEAAAIQLSAARVQASTGNLESAHNLVRTVLARRPNHAAARALAAELKALGAGS